MFKDVRLCSGLIFLYAKRGLTDIRANQTTTYRSRTRLILLLCSGWLSCVYCYVWCFTVQQYSLHLLNISGYAMANTRQHSDISKQLRCSEIITHLATVLDGVWLILKHNTIRTVLPSAQYITLITLCHKRTF